jgi:hypothetical protein
MGGSWLSRRISFSPGQCRTRAQLSSLARHPERAGSHPLATRFVRTWKPSYPHVVSVPSLWIDARGNRRKERATRRRSCGPEFDFVTAPFQTWPAMNSAGSMSASVGTSKRLKPLVIKPMRPRGEAGGGGSENVCPTASLTREDHWTRLQVCWMDGWMGVWMDGCMGGCMDGWVYGWMGVWMDGCMDGWVYGWMERARVSSLVERTRAVSSEPVSLGHVSH